MPANATFRQLDGCGEGAVFDLAVKGRAGQSRCRHHCLDVQQCRLKLRDMERLAVDRGVCGYSVFHDIND